VNCEANYDFQVLLHVTGNKQIGASGVEERLRCHKGEK
jgi:hypothetical protein